MNERQNQQKILLKKIDQILAGYQEGSKKLQLICDLLRNSMTKYDWVGFYLIDPRNERMLNLGPYAGESTIHKKIEFGEGICGQAADKKTPIIVDDVGRESNYLACSLEVKSEIVLPIFKKGRIIGELDIDSHTRAAFNEEDKRFLALICDKLSETL
jgi:GAF domain-containing protein